MRSSASLRVLLLSILLIVQGYCILAQSSNDHIFPPAAAAASYSNFDAKGFIINGKRTFIVSAGLEYARIPHELWKDRLLRLKRAGFNCIEIYTFWNFHEPHEGQFDFTGDHDLGAFLKQVKALGMYAIVRVGPYYCAEWDFGGYPIWLRFKDSVMVRQPNAQFENYTSKFFDHLLPVVRDNQIHKGGSVILVQLENEHPEGWGTVLPNDYFKFLQKKAIQSGIEVPYFFSGLHHANDPAGNRMLLDDANRPNPWMSTEFWSVWYDYYSSTQKDADIYGRRTWKVIARGGNGYNFYMAHGGTNFGYTNNNEDAASYDYGAAVGQTGDLRPLYYQNKRNGLFAQSFQEILENSSDAGKTYSSWITDTALHINGRHSAAGDIAFIDNPSAKAITTKITIGSEQLPANGELIITPGEIFPVVQHFKLAGNTMLDWAVCRVLGVQHNGNTTTLVVYGPAGSPAALQFSGGQATPVTGKEVFQSTGSATRIQFSFAAEQPAVYSFKAGSQTIRVLAVSTALADRTWFTEAGNQQYVVTGPEYVSEFAMVNNKPVLTAEHFWEQQQQYPIAVYGEQEYHSTVTINNDQPKPISFNNSWQVKNASAAAEVRFDDSKWKKSQQALQMGADDDLTADAWYRTTVNIEEAGTYTFKPQGGGDRVTIFVDGKKAAAGSIRDTELQLELAAGKHQLAFFTAHGGRDKLFNYLGSLKDVDAKGLSGRMVLRKGPASIIPEWKVIRANGKDALNNPPASFDTGTVVRTGGDPFRGRRGYAWFSTSFTVDANRLPEAIQFKGVDDNGVVFLNGKEVYRQNGYGVPFTIPLKGQLNMTGQNTLTVFVENTGGAGGISRPVEFVYNDKNTIVLTNWSMQGGPGNPNAADGWKPLATDAAFDRPTFFKNSFTVQGLSSAVHPMYRVSIEKLGHGSVWVNGHNIGRYPEKVPIRSMYIPECWLKEGVNNIVVYDEDGKTPVAMQVAPEVKASRNAMVVRF